MTNDNTQGGKINYEEAYKHTLHCFEVKAKELEVFKKAALEMAEFYASGKWRINSFDEITIQPARDFIDKHGEKK